MILVRFERLAPGNFSKTLVRGVLPSHIGDHGTLCRAFNLDPHRTRFDLPRSWYQGGGGPGTACNGVVFFEDEPLGKLTIMREQERVHDRDPLDARDFYNLNA